MRLFEESKNFYNTVTKFEVMLSSHCPCTSSSLHELYTSRRVSPLPGDSCIMLCLFERNPVPYEWILHPGTQ